MGISDRAHRADRNHASFRVGAASGVSRPQLCLELSPHERIGVDWCGTGATWLHNDDASDMMHLRMLFRVGTWKTPFGYLQPRLGAGIAEFAIGADQPGFNFSGVGANGVETAGPEATASLRLLTPLAGGFELLTHIDATAAYFAHAPDMVVPQSSFQPGLSVTIGFGF